MVDAVASLHQRPSHFLRIQLGPLVHNNVRTGTGNVGENDFRLLHPIRRFLLLVILREPLIYLRAVRIFRGHIIPAFCRLARTSCEAFSFAFLSQTHRKLCPTAWRP
uniref:Uncharacterized protein n=1 Tax=Hemiselmis andersenii TaxID=464988 RepID=A0A7S0THB9_HEMAN